MTFLGNWEWRNKLTYKKIERSKEAFISKNSSFEVLSQRRNEGRWRSSKSINGWLRVFEVKIRDRYWD